MNRDEILKSNFRIIRLWQLMTALEQVEDLAHVAPDAVTEWCENFLNCNKKKAN